MRKADVVEFRVLGPMEVVVGGRPAELTARRPRTVLAALLLRAGEVVPVDALVEAVWGGAAPASAGSVLRMYVTQVRRALGDGRVVTKAPGYMLVVGEGELDSDRFERLFADGRRALADGNPRLARRLCAGALELWRGEAFADLAAEGFVGHEAARLDELRLGCLEIRIGADLQLGRHDGVLAELEQLVAPGGIGKTRLAVELARRLDPELTDGAVMVDLAPVFDPAQLLPAIGRALGLREGATPWPELLAVHLRHLELLIVLDNLEHLADATAPLGELVAAAPRLTLLATSRRVLRLAAEEIVEVAPLERSAAL